MMIMMMVMMMSLPLQIAAGGDHSFAVTDAGRVFAFGYAFCDCDPRIDHVWRDAWPACILVDAKGARLGKRDLIIQNPNAKLPRLSKCACIEASFVGEEAFSGFDALPRQNPMC